jgi:Sel1 repeat
MSLMGQKPRPSQPRHVSFHPLRTLDRASIRWSTALLSHGVGRCHPLANQGVAEAQSNLGVMYEQGQGVPQDYAEAVMWFRKADEGCRGKRDFRSRRIALPSPPMGQIGWPRP